MFRRIFLRNLTIVSSIFSIGIPIGFLKKPSRSTKKSIFYDIIIIGGTPSGIMAAITASRMGKKALILERTTHLGGLPANGLGATDISTRGSTRGLFLEFINRIRKHYEEIYGSDSQQVQDCSEGYHFEPRVAEKVFQEMIESEKLIDVLYSYQFDANPEFIQMKERYIESIRVFNRKNKIHETFSGHVFIDATYEGDLIAAAGVPYFVGREGYEQFGEPYAGRVYKYWNGPSAEGSTLLGDNAIQSFNYRLCLTDLAGNIFNIQKPESYCREEYLSLIDDVKTGMHTGNQIRQLTQEQAEENKKRVERGEAPEVPGMPQGIWRITNMVKLPNQKTDANNQHLAFISTDLPEENWPWPTSGWKWRDKFAERLKNYTLGLFWFAQNDPDLPEWFKKETRKWGLAKDEYVDNGHFPRQVYVREGRRMIGKYFFTAQDALSEKEGSRPPIHSTSITSSHYAIDSHAVRKREPGRAHLDGFLNYSTRPYTVPFGVILPEKVENLLSPVPVSGSHLGFSTLRMEPCWMALGQAAGVAAVLSINSSTTVQKIEIDALQKVLLNQNAILIYFEDVPQDDPDFELVQFMGLKKILTSWKAELDKPIDKNTAQSWFTSAEVSQKPNFTPGKTSRREFLRALNLQMQKK